MRNVFSYAQALLWRLDFSIKPAISVAVSLYVSVAQGGSESAWAALSLPNRQARDSQLSPGKHHRFNHVCFKNANVDVVVFTLFVVMETFLVYISSRAIVTVQLPNGSGAHETYIQRVYLVIVRTKHIETRQNVHVILSLSYYYFHIYLQVPIFY